MLNKNIFNNNFYNKVVSGSNYPWGVTFVYHCFKSAGSKLLDRFNGGKKTNNLTELIDYYKSCNRYIPKNDLLYNIGDLVFINKSGESTPNILGIVSKNQIDDTITVIAGDIKSAITDKSEVTELVLKAKDIIGGAKLGEQVTLSFNSIDNKLISVYNYLKENTNYNNAAICGLLSNIKNESNFNTLFSTNDGVNSKHGLCGWTNLNNIYNDFISWCNENNFDKDSLNTQVKYMLYEINTKYPDVDKYLSKIENSSLGSKLSAEYIAKNFNIDSSEKTVDFINNCMDYAKNNLWTQLSTNLKDLTLFNNFKQDVTNKLSLPIHDDIAIISKYIEDKHNSLDLVAKLGNSFGLDVYPIDNGTVVYFGKRDADFDKGKYVIISHENGIRSIYSHLNGFADLEIGAKVSVNDKLGYIGNSGITELLPTKGEPHKGSCLSLEITVNGEYVNPEDYLPKLDYIEN